MFEIGDEIICKKSEEGVYVDCNEVVTVVFCSNATEKFDLTIIRKNGYIQFCSSENFELHRKK